MKGSKIAIGIVLVLFAVVVGTILNRGKNKAAIRPNFYSGIVEAKQFHLGFKTPGTVSELFVSEGENVTQGQRLASLDSRELEARLDQAKALQGQAQAQLLELQNGSRPEDIQAAYARVAETTAELARLENGVTPNELDVAFHQSESARHRAALKDQGFRIEEIEQGKARLEQAKAELAAAQQDEQRYRVLLQEGAAPEAITEEKIRRSRQAQARVREVTESLELLKKGFQAEDKAAARQDYLSSKSRYEVLKDGTRPELIQAANARVASANAALLRLQNGVRPETIEQQRKVVEARTAEVTRLDSLLADHILTAPANATVTSVSFEVGETVSTAASTVQLTELSKVWVNVFVPEAEVTSFALGDQCEIFLDSTPETPLRGRVSYVSQTPEFTPRFVQTQRERVLLVYRVEISVDNENGLLKPGIPADVQIQPGQKAESP